MTRDETVKIIRIMVDSYPNYKPSNLSETVDVWNMVLKEYSYQQISTALKAFILSDTSGFAPSIGQLVNIVTMTSGEQVPNELEAWGMVSKALKNGYYGAEEEFAKLPSLVQKAIGQPSQLRQWAQTNIESVENVIQSNFIKTYRTLAKRSYDVSKMPVEVQKMIESNSPVPVLENNTVEPIECKTRTPEGVPMPEKAKERLKELLK